MRILRTIGLLSADVYGHISMFPDDASKPAAVLLLLTALPKVHPISLHKYPTIPWQQT